MTIVINDFLPGYWGSFAIWGSLAIGCWVMAFTLFLPKGSPKKNTILKLSTEHWVLLGIIVLILWLASLWINLQRPPLRTLGETRVWYSILLPFCGWLVSRRWQIKWPMLYCNALAMLFILLTAFNPETQDKTLMPALQSYWFVPHVVVYMVAYAFLSAASLSGFKVLGEGILFKFKKNKSAFSWSPETLLVIDNTVQIGFSFLTLGLLFGAMWAKEAWGHYWTWDPKETWALLTWLIYLAYIHFRTYHHQRFAVAHSMIASSFLILLLCWFGVNYMPSAKLSVHTYTNDK